ncbi:hypothetical protein BU25DRAFT_417717 [Macroventuria anomochaeta]|uniref:Uncharacterized protein n=1 Tax=Macroventuria anomochaeta TaxID=301207 RepID=A0ACB6SCD2_9PLEO|nr:uncharacterized protein BU25DRAFT_417717 [Macroventuria anomochaeta]KAF2631940.1 hypothetical protein BU25DRAFT_417717 [Macroventuria anomochaeta]
MPLPRIVDLTISVVFCFLYGHNFIKDQHQSGTVECERESEFAVNPEVAVPVSRPALRATQVGTAVTPTPTSLSLFVSSVSQTASSSSSPTGTSSPSASATPSNDDNALSAGAKAGIAIGAVFAVIAVAATGYLFYRNHRKIKELEARAYPQELNVEPKTVSTEYCRHDYQPVPPS